MNDKGIENLKIWPEYFKALWDEHKSFEVRENHGRNFERGVIVKLNEWDKEKKQKTGAYIVAEILYVLHGPKWGLKDGWSAFAFSVKEKVRP